MFSSIVSIPDVLPLIANDQCQGIDKNSSTNVESQLWQFILHFTMDVYAVQVHMRATLLLSGCGGIVINDGSDQSHLLWPMVTCIIIIEYSVLLNSAAFIYAKNELLLSQVNRV